MISPAGFIKITHGLLLFSMYKSTNKHLLRFIRIQVLCMYICTPKILLTIWLTCLQYNVRIT